jgi:hypothetical protein
MSYDDFSITIAREQGAPEPEANAARANAIIALIVEKRFNEARRDIGSVSDPMIAQDLRNLLDFWKTCPCLDPPK